MKDVSFLCSLVYLCFLGNREVVISAVGIKFRHLTVLFIPNICGLEPSLRPVCHHC